MKRNDSVKLLLERGADPNTLNAQRSVPLITAINYDNIDIIKTLLEYGADPGIENAKVLTLFMVFHFNF